ncbi:hypothetical protein BSKO_01146 [Bryopsis sp. KO-2023]|nr:hypothetical protein BSKO_01146 [Bryopsis sp. KO-2023]
MRIHARPFQSPPHSPSHLRGAIHRPKLPVHRNRTLSHVISGGRQLSAFSAREGATDHHANVSVPPPVDRKKELIKIVGKTKAEAASRHAVKIFSDAGRVLFETKGGGIHTAVKALSTMTHVLMDNVGNWFDVFLYMDDPTMLKLVPVPDRLVSFLVVSREDPFDRFLRNREGNVLFPEVIRVEDDTHPTEIRSAVVDRIGAGPHVVVRCRGVRSIESGLMGIAYTRKCLLEEGVDLAMVPTFAKVVDEETGRQEVGFDFFLFLRPKA